MKQEIIPSPKQSALAIMASKFSVEPARLLETLKATLMPKATNEELLSFVVPLTSTDSTRLPERSTLSPLVMGESSPLSQSMDGYA